MLGATLRCTMWMQEGAIGGSAARALQNILESEKARPSTSSARSLVGQIGAGLRALWAKQVVHLDIKLENLVLSDQNT